MTPPGDGLTYTFGSGTNDSSYRIDQATGQITVGPRTALDRETIGGTFTPHGSGHSYRSDRCPNWRYNARRDHHHQ